MRGLIFCIIFSLFLVAIGTAAEYMSGEVVKVEQECPIDKVVKGALIPEIKADNDYWH